MRNSARFPAAASLMPLPKTCIEHFVIHRARVFMYDKTGMTTHQDPMHGFWGNEGQEFSHALPVVAPSSRLTTLDLTSVRFDHAGFDRSGKGAW